ncbi:MAG: hypothetical protein ABJN04_12065 [Hyphomicrobiales bacterium]
MLATWFDRTFSDLRAQFRWSFLPPLMVYFAAGIQGLTSIVGVFFVKDYLGLSAEFLVSLTFWTVLPWTLKMPLGHLVDIIWRWKAILVYLGAGLLAASLSIMYGLITSPEEMRTYMPAEYWYVLATLLAPCGYVLQDVVADGMAVEAVPATDDQGNDIDDTSLKIQHTTMQTLGRIALFTGYVSVALVNIFMFDGIEQKSEAEKVTIYGQIYFAALIIPLVSISGVLLASFLKQKRRAALRAMGMAKDKITDLVDRTGDPTTPNMWFFGGGLVFVILSLTVGLGDVVGAKEIVFIASLAIIIFMMRMLAKELTPTKAKMLFGTAIVVFIFRAMPSPGPGLGWFEIDVLKFDQQFLAVLSLITAFLALAGMIVLRPLMAEKPINTIIIILTVAGTILFVPSIALYYGIHNWTSSLTGGVVDARFIAVLDTAIEAPLGQIAVIPLLAWIARNAPTNLKATFFAVMASFINLALSAASLLTTYLNKIFIITREVKNQETGAVEVMANYDQLGYLLIAILIITFVAPLAAIFIVQRSPLKTFD